MAKPNLDQMAAEYCSFTKNGLMWKHFYKMANLYGWDEAKAAVKRAKEVRKLMGL
jgi:hypothetical protein